MIIRLVQINISDSKEESIRAALKQAQPQSGKESPDVMIFPEMFVCGFDDPSHIEDCAIFIEEWEEQAGFFSLFRELAVKQNCYLILGSIPLKESESEKPFNTSIAISPQGEWLYRYDKTNLFPLMEESRSFSPGQSSLTDNFQITRGSENFLSQVRICYDLRFPEIFRNDQAGFYPEMIFLPMQWPAPRTETFLTLARSRSIENQAYMAVCNRVGRDKNNSFDGGSFVSGPDGKVLSQMGTQEGCLDVVVDKEQLKIFRHRYPFLKNRKNEKELTKQIN